MQFLPPCDALKPYVKGFMVVANDKDQIDGVFYPSGYIDVAIHILGNIVTIINGKPIDMPKVEVLGQLTVPTRLTVTKGTVVLVARIYPHANALFFPNPIADFTNDSVDLQGVIGKGSAEFYTQFIETGTIEQKVKALESFLLHRLISNQKLLKKVTLLEQLCRQILREGDLFNIKSLTAKHGLSERYIQKLFVDNVGLAPRTFFHVHRFNKSLQLIHSPDLSLTSIAYDCGYYDQAHFIREFKRFTGLTPSEIRSMHSMQ